MKLIHSESYRKLGLNVVFHRKDKGLTQQQLAELIGKEVRTVGRIECGKTGITVDVIFDMARALEIPAHKLFEPRD